MNSRCLMKSSPPVSLQPDPAIAANGEWLPASDIAKAVAAKQTSALAVTEAALARIAAHNPVLNAFTDVTAERARTKAKAIDAALAAGETVGPLAGVPFAVKNLFDIEGLPTRAGSKINRERAPASSRDGTLVEPAGGGGRQSWSAALNMGEYAYDFTGENVHDGAVPQPPRPRRA